MGRNSLFIGLLLISLMISGFITKNTLEIYKSREAVKQSQNDLQSLKEENIKLQQEVEYRETDEFIVNEAREKLNYGYENEEIIIVPTNSFAIVNEKNPIGTTEQIQNINKNNSKPIPYLWFSTLFGG